MHTMYASNVAKPIMAERPSAMQMQAREMITTLKN
jgi:hypothetical protein